MPARTTQRSKPVRTTTAKAESAPKSRKTDLKDWRDDTLDHMRSLIIAADPKITEERKWKKPSNGMVGVPVWSRDGIICTGETYKDKVKLTFPKGSALEDPDGLFNAGERTRRAIDIREGEVVDAKAFKTLVKATVALNGASKKK